MLHPLICVKISQLFSVVNGIASLRSLPKVYGEGVLAVTSRKHLRGCDTRNSS